jgi:ribosome-associated translation inhibitor RaiA
MILKISPSKETKMTTVNELLSLEARVNISDEIVVRENKDGTVIAMKMDDGDLFYKIDGAAAKIFKDLRKNKDLKTSVQEIADFFKVELVHVQKDASEFLKQLQTLGFISLIE